MGQILVRQLDETVIEGIKQSAQANNRSMEAEVRLVLERNYGSARKARGQVLRDLLDMPPTGRSQSEIDQYVAGLRAEWGE